MTSWGQTASKATTPATTLVADGNYMGLEAMASESPEEPDAQWFHENTLIVRNGEFILDELPVAIRGEEKSYSASDGGFITYRGRFLIKNERLYVSLRPFMSDYIIFPIGHNACEPYSRVDIFPVKNTDAGFWINGVRYQLHATDPDRLKELEGMLKSEPLKYDGQHPYMRKYRFPECEPNDLSRLDE